MRRSWWLGLASAAMVLGAIAGTWVWLDDGPAQTKNTAVARAGGAANQEPLPFSRSDADTFIPVTAQGFQFAGIPATVK